MSTDSSSYPKTRREFLKQSTCGLGFIAFSTVAPSFITQSLRAGAPIAEKDRSILVLIQLAGGNDGLNTVVPYADDNYYRLRPKLGLKQKQLHKLNDQLGFHPACGKMHGLFEDGKLGIIQNVGYPNPNRSHFRSMEIWETASDSNDYLTDGWVGRYFDNACSGSPSPDPAGLNIGNELPDAFLSNQEHNIFSLQGNQGRRNGNLNGLLSGVKGLSYKDDSNANFLQHTLMDTLVTERRVLEKIGNYRSMEEYPQTRLGNALNKVAGLIASGMETRVYFVSHGGFDTHANQALRHKDLLTQLSDAMHAFQSDLEAHALQDQVLTMTFSEFGRRPSENASGGTDHGTAAPQFVMGSQLNKSLLGQAPDLSVGINKDLKHSTDFRSVYGTVLQRWFETDPEPILGGKFPPVDFLA
ncbi:DUF1501 domain-containing protein [Puniceicoccales bacterium CK1056]|uniref:DUF1501 domain-containing protein n=1 Tax=Oceanipulchritudo coccoides TaxID=2706888 RepID=A0A6B2M381_9BACT|nr:DUF1501 domain-containing protein [Oceanipulchritudo coccoides]NDV63213.1 DUF1501 domain-containing protein [Oceanipulchritudo coccoides]